jgi:hypothetical protein
MKDDGSWLDLGGSETAELTDAFWRDPDRLRHAAARLREKAQRADHRFEMLQSEPVEPEPPSLETLVSYPRIDDPPYDEEARRAAEGRAEIMKALVAEEKQAEQQRRQTQADARAEARQTALGRLLGDTKHG